MSITALLSIYAAFLSTIVFVWNVLRDKPRLRTELLPAIEENELGLQTGATVIVSNHSPRTAHLNSISLYYRCTPRSVRASILHFAKYRTWSHAVGWMINLEIQNRMDFGLPTAIEPGAAHRVFVPDETIEELLSISCSRDIKASAQDALGRNSYSSTLNYIE